MSAHAIATKIRDEVRAFRRRERFCDQAAYLESKDAHCQRINGLVDDLMRAIGTPAPLSMRPGPRFLGRRSIQVVMRDAPMAKRA
ncbi:hypothetical protein [Methylobacterium nonmethylotrophicum]|uniref:Uncharacterized protein n=1 Tax=Methylobacterium nonmethylotrophicum TaxID=1141884 RepID=A0A4Z0NE16_9HYPH|nr:hypothetical protein [Methylobacterium nonmethylotrophicum]TGD94050.1 hypothetical protein EU555_32525 [Methylobacterium nonmethylotrophicum]